MFQKLNINLPHIDLKRLQGQNTAEIGTFMQYEIADVEYLYSLFDDIVLGIKPDMVNITVITGNGPYLVQPHTDVWPTALNYYINADTEITTFYDNPTDHKIKSHIPGLYGYREEKLVARETFCANTGDCYLLNTHRPHSVSRINADSSRTLLRLIWSDHLFESVLESISLHR